MSNEKLISIAIAMAVGSVSYTTQATITTRTTAGSGQNVTITDDVEYSGFNSSALYAHDGGKIASDGYNIQGGTAGSAIYASGGTIEVKNGTLSGNVYQYVNVDNGGQAILDNIQFDSDPSNVQIKAAGAGSFVSFSNSIIHDFDDMLISMNDRAEISLDNVQLNQTGSSSGAAILYMDSKNSATITNSSLSSIGSSTITANDGSIVTLDRASLSTTYDNGDYPGSYAVVGLSNSTLEAKNTTFTANGDVWGISASSSDVTLKESHLDMNINQAYGINLSNSALTLSDSVINASGDGNYLVIANGGSNNSLSVTNSQITATGDKNYAFYADGYYGNSLYNITDSAISVSGNTSYGAFIIGSKAAGEIINTTITAEGENSSALRLADVGSTKIVGSTLYSKNSTAVVLQDRNDESDNDPLSLTLDNAQIISDSGLAFKIYDYNNNSGLLLNEVNIDATNGTAITGDVLVNSSNVDSTLVFNLSGASTLTGAINTQGYAGASTANIDATSRWNVTSNSALTTLNNAGTVSFVTPDDASGFKTITVDGDYYGADGSKLLMNTQLGDDSSPTDMLVINGDSAGSTSVSFNNVGGSGAQTVEGIKVIDVAGQSDAVFTMEGRAVKGGYDYSLYQGSVSDPANGNWYLRSVDSPNPDPTPTPSINPTRPEAGAYLGNQTAAVNMFTHTMHERLGEPEFTQPNGTDGGVGGMWLRAVGNSTDSKAAGQSLNVDTDTTLVQLGGDLARWDSNDQRFLFGVMAGYGHSDVDSTNPNAYKADASKASGDVDGYSVGLYATWFGSASMATGGYMDTYVQYAWFDNTVKGQDLPSEEYKSRLWQWSVESGYAFTLGNAGNYQWLVEPQAQLIYDWYSADTHTEQNGTRIHGGDANGLTTRLGARLYGRMERGEGVQPFVGVNWWHGDANNALKMDNDRFSQDVPDNRYEVEIGLQARISNGWQAWAQLSNQTGENGYRNSEGVIGVKYVW
ncbi:autotransporter outer membrane beta-barrel domain-containing protein [Leminorella grimontii]|uniref:autotransporter family protein n=1 Tax=Leminorella grimontii TaxID=82981 RepID=UPI00321FF222